MDAPQLNEDELNEIYSWVDSISLSRPKKNMARDFADGVLIAEVIAQFFPRLVQLHNYSGANSMKQKIYNWETLQSKVFKKIGLQLSKNDIESVINCVPEAIERVLRVLQLKIQDMLNGQQGSPQKRVNYSNGSGSDQGQQRAQSSQKQDEIIWEKDQTINELRETIDILELKIKKLEDLIKLKDNKINTLQNKLAEHGLY
ncbi:hypothetical protein IMG5_118970 [Ichthyophthirius multifiliis]|uniref:Calponin-homology (CH) domain-containing protein n=1 Tax=Ichthyophthirius multifiliis TaxID=5932 RepID=G0QUS6_ICHMU|nr:hypothetical protein IMG5_118970 [Ichthyophthirius multifiliis]EGR31024.1 hypothetical protein IMG5_118970 [Ichthyophthirius multifiliis]|eukprot:XP_004034510.1 hypothetical protein IMG5_118970 [Ichthyophthirius multifiliis]